jgi:hypothetical protein
MNALPAKISATPMRSRQVRGGLKSWGEGPCHRCPSTETSRSGLPNPRALQPALWD